MSNYRESKGVLPTNIRSKTGVPLLSWRVRLLPELEDGAVYQQFHLDEPWDSPHNLALLPQMPYAYRSVWDSKSDAGKTYYQVFVGKGTVFTDPRLLREKAVFNGKESHQTILVIEAGEPVPWTKPEDLVYKDDQPLPSVGGLFPGGFMISNLSFTTPGFNALFADGSVRFVAKNNVDESLLRQSIAGKGKLNGRLGE